MGCSIEGFEVGFEDDGLKAFCIKGLGLGFMCLEFQGFVLEVCVPALGAEIFCVNILTKNSPESRLRVAWLRQIHADIGSKHTWLPFYSQFSAVLNPIPIPQSPMCTRLIPKIRGLFEGS